MTALLATWSSTQPTGAGAAESAQRALIDHAVVETKVDRSLAAHSYRAGLPEGDSLHRAAERLRVLEGELLAVESPHPRAAALGIAPRARRETPRAGRGGRQESLARRSKATSSCEATCACADAGTFEGPAAPLDRPSLARASRPDTRSSPLERPGAGAGPERRRAGSGRTSWRDPPDLAAMVARLRTDDPEPPDRRRAPRPAARRRDREHVAGGGALSGAELSPGRRSPSSTTDARAVLRAASRSDAGRAPRAQVYRRAGLPCRRCGTRIARWSARRRRPYGVLVPGLPGRNGARQRVTVPVNQRPVRSPALYRALGTSVSARSSPSPTSWRPGPTFPSPSTEHGGHNRPTLYEYRPLVGAFVEQRAGWLGTREDALGALAALKDEPAAGIFARAHMSAKAGEDEALRRTVLVPLLVRMRRALRRVQLGRQRFRPCLRGARAIALRRAEGVRGACARSSASRPVGASSSGLGSACGPAATGEFQASWPEAGRLLPRDYGREVDRTLLVELERDLDTADPAVPDAPAEIARAVSALRIATPGAIAAGPVLFERLDWRPYNVGPCRRSPRSCRRGRPRGWIRSAAGSPRELDPPPGAPGR